MSCCRDNRTKRAANISNRLARTGLLREARAVKKIISSSSSIGVLPPEVMMTPSKKAQAFVGGCCLAASKNEKALDQEVLKKIARAIALLDESIHMMKAAGELYYERGNNHRGNIRSDASDALDLALKNLKSRTSYLPAAFKR